jgi:dihydrofolate synthase/folylpolyglutamate synthase
MPGGICPLTFQDAIEFLYGLRWFGAKLGLANTLKLAELAGNPHHKLRFVHVAGTNGKGSTCAMLESIYRAAGLRVGLFTSPHLIAFGERIQVNRRPVSESSVARLVGEMQVLLERGWGAASESPDPAKPPSGAAGHPTFFEVVTVMALRYFAQRQCELVVWETGLGGRLDATNIVTPLASVITNIQYDHQQWLGETLDRIAAEKAGIIKPGVPVITATDAPEALRVIEETARQKQAPLSIVTPSDAHRPPLDAMQLPLQGEHQQLNAALAVATVRRLTAEIPVSEDQIRAGLLRVRWAGRLQLVARPGGRRILLDGAHNEGGAEILAAALKTYRGAASRITLVLGVLQDKDWATMSRILAPLAERILLVPVASERSASPPELAEACRRANPGAVVTEHSTLREALAETSHDAFVAVAGSLYLVGEAMELLELSPGKRLGERGLNDWKEPASTALPPSGKKAATRR